MCGSPDGLQKSPRFGGRGLGLRAGVAAFVSRPRSHRLSGVGGVDHGPDSEPCSLDSPAGLWGCAHSPRGAELTAPGQTPDGLSSGCTVSQETAEAQAERRGRGPPHPGRLCRPAAGTKRTGGEGPAGPALRGQVWLAGPGQAPSSLSFPSQGDCAHLVVVGTERGPECGAL